MAKIKSAPTVRVVKLGVVAEGEAARAVVAAVTALRKARAIVSNSLRRSRIFSTTRTPTGTVAC